MVADTSNPAFWGVTGAMYLVILIVIWKLTFGWGEAFGMKFKIICSIAMLPLTIGLCYVMGKGE